MIDLLLLDRLSGLLLETALKSSLLMVVFLSVDRLLLRRRPILADAMWSSAIVLLLILPAASWKLPRIEVAVPLDRSAAGLEPPAISPGSDTGSFAETGLGELSDVETPFATSLPTLAPQEQPRATDRSRISVRRIAVLVYCFGAAICLVRLVHGNWSLRRLRRSLVPLTTGNWAALMEQYRKQLRISRPVGLYQSAEVTVPLTVGWLRPIIVVPTASVHQAGSRCAEMVLLHELVHIARGDYLVHCAMQFTKCVYWYNPLTWLAARRLAQLREAVCDGYCVARLQDQDGYVEVLLRYAHALSGKPKPAVGLTMARESRLERRIMNLLPMESCSLGLIARSLLLLSATAAGFVIAAAAFGDQQPEGATAGKPELSEIVAGLRERESAVRVLTVRCDWENMNSFAEPGKPLAKGLIEDDAISSVRKGKLSWLVDRNGRGRMQAEYEKVNTRFDGSRVVKRQEFLSAYDGKTGKVRTTASTPEGVVISRRTRATERFSRTAQSPFDLTVHHLGTPISELVSQEGSRVIGSRLWEDRLMWVVETPPVVVRNDYIYRQQFWIDRERNWSVPRRQVFVQRGEDKPWGLHLMLETQDSDQVAPGVWLPRSVDYWNFLVTAEGRKRLTSTAHFKEMTWSVNDSLPDAQLRLAPDSIERIGQAVPQRKTGEGIADHPQVNKAAPPGYRHMLLSVVDRQGTPVADTRIYVNIWPEGEFATSRKNYFTNPKGEAVVLVPDPPRLFRVWTQKSGFVPLFAQWWPENQPDGHLVPDAFTFHLDAGTEIGGTVCNEDGDPVAGAIVEVMLANRVEEMRQRPVPSIWLAEVPGPGKNPCITDAAGKWQLGNVPGGGDTHVRLKVSHPDYISDRKWGSLQQRQGVGMKALREKTAVLMLPRGIVVSGRVQDPTGSPVPRAVVVWGDDPYMEEGSQEVHTNAEGVFTLAPLPRGPIDLTVVASGWAPARKTLEVAKGSGVDFQLEKGHALRIRFLDEDGAPVPGVHVGIRGWRGAKSLYNHRHPNVLDTGIPVRANGEGRYEWNWAPADEVELSFYVKGFNSQQQSITANGAEHVIRLSSKAAVQEH